MEDINRTDMELDIEQIKERLPHRYPFLMVDRIVEIKPGYCKGIKNITANEPQFMGHFPDQAIMPGQLISEAIAQTSAFVGPPEDEEEEGEAPPEKAFLTKINSKFKQPVVVGDQLEIEVEVVKKMGKLSKFSGEASVDGDVVAEVEFTTAAIE